LGSGHVSKITGRLNFWFGSAWFKRKMTFTEVIGTIKVICKLIHWAEIKLKKYILNLIFSAFYTKSDRDLANDPNPSGSTILDITNCGTTSDHSQTKIDTVLLVFPVFQIQIRIRIRIGSVFSSLRDLDVGSTFKMRIPNPNPIVHFDFFSSYKDWL